MSYHIRYEELDKHWIVKRTTNSQPPIIMRFTSEEQAKQYIEKEGPTFWKETKQQCNPWGDEDNWDVENNSEKEG
jgi:hypothetical protein